MGESRFMQRGGRGGNEIEENGRRARDVAEKEKEEGGKVGESRVRKRGGRGGKKMRRRKKRKERMMRRRK